MRRLVLILLVLVLPFHVAWAAAASYCQHEATAAGGWHFGHHEHRHQGGSGHSQAESAAKASDGKLADMPTKDGKPVWDNDCGVCHIASAQVAPASHPLLLQPARVESAPQVHAARYASANPPTPDRPQWQRLR